MSDKKTHLIFISLIALLSLIVTLTNLGLRKDFIGDDAGVNLIYPDTLSKSVWNMWDETTFPGRANTLSTIAFIFANILLFAYKIGLSSMLVERLLYFSFFFASGSGFYFLFNRLAQKEGFQDKFIYIASFTSSLLYSFNYFTTVMTSFPLTNYHISYLTLPWLLLLVIKAFDNNMSFTSIVTVAFLVVFLFGGNPSNTISILVFTLIFAIAFKQTYKFRMSHAITFLVLLLTFLSYIYLPILANRSDLYSGVNSNENIDSLNFNSSRTSFVNLFRFYGFHSETDFPFYNMQTHNQFFVYISFFVPILIIAGLVPNKPPRVMKFFLFSALVFLFLAKGSHTPLSSWFFLPFNKIFILQMYRATYYKFIMFVVLSFSMLLGFAIIKLKNKLAVRHFAIFLYALPFLVIANAWPLVSGQSARKIHLAEVPNEYKQTGEFMRSKSLDFKVLSVPQLPGALLEWGENNYYAASYLPDAIIFGRPVWVNTWFNSKLEKYFFDEKGLDKALSLTKFFNIKYVLVHHDVVEKKSFGISSAERLSSLLDSTPNMKQISKNKYHSIYEIDNDHYLSHIYFPDTVHTTDNSDLDILKTNILLDADKKEVIYFTKQNETKLNELKSFASTFKTNPKVSIEYKKVNPTKYILDVSNTTGIFPVVFSESFHTEWKIYLKNNNLENGYFYETWFSPQIDDNTHFVANGYANSWILNTMDLCKQPGLCTLNSDGTYNMSLIIEFKPQQYFYLGLLISVTSIIITSLICLVKGCRRIYKRK